MLCDITHSIDWLLDSCSAWRGGYGKLRTNIFLGESVRKHCKRWPEGDGLLIGIKLCKKHLWSALFKVNTKSSLTPYIDIWNDLTTEFLPPLSFALPSAAMTAETNFTFMWPCIITNFFIIKPTRCTNFTNLFWHETLRVSDSTSVHHQEFIHCTLSNGMCHPCLCTNLYDIYHCWVYSE